MTEIRGLSCVLPDPNDRDREEPAAPFFYESCAEPIGMGFGRIMNFRENDGGNHFGKHT